MNRDQAGFVLGGILGLVFAILLLIQQAAFTLVGVGIIFIASAIVVMHVLVALSDYRHATVKTLFATVVAAILLAVMTNALGNASGIWSLLGAGYEGMILVLAGGLSILKVIQS